MFLLILAGTLKTGQSNPDFTFHNVSINTQAMLGVKVDGDFFTFHNVSINTGTVTEYNQRTYFLYIPQCFY